MSHSYHIMVVQPPPFLPNRVASRVRTVQNALTAAGHKVEFFDAAHDFLENYALAADVAKGVIERIADASYKKESMGATDFAWLVDRMAKQPAPLVALGSTQAADAASAAEALRTVDLAMAMLAAAFAPVHLDRRSFSHPALKDMSDLIRFAADAAANPFLAYARDHCRAPFALDRYDAVILAVQSPGQLAPALTLAVHWRTRWTRLRLLLCCADQRLQSTADLLFPQAGMVDGIIDRLKSSLDKETVCSADGAVVHRTLAASDGPEPKQWIDEAEKQRARLIIWHQPAGAPGSDEAAPLLYKTAKDGHWNHLILRHERNAGPMHSLARFAYENPNIVHSWTVRRASETPFCDAVDHFPEKLGAYGRTQPLPWEPLWIYLQDPAYIQSYLAQCGVKELVRTYLRTSVDGGFTKMTAGSNLIYRFLPPDKLPAGCLDEICLMVEAGGSVGTQWVRHNLERAFLIGYVEEQGVIVGNSSLKYPRQEYIQAVSRQSGIDLRNYLERGYTSVRPAYRGLGIGAGLLEGLTRRTGDYRIFSVIAENNIATQKMAIRNNTRRVATFFSRRAQKEMSVWIPEWMLPEGIDLPPQPDLE